MKRVKAGFVRDLFSVEDEIAAAVKRPGFLRQLAVRLFSPHWTEMIQQLSSVSLGQMAS